MLRSDSRNAVRENPLVARDDLQTLDSGLSDQHPVKRVAVKVGQPRNHKGMFDMDWKFRESTRRNCRAERVRRFQFSQALLDIDLPSADSARVDDVFPVGDLCARLFRYQPRAGEPPEQGVSIKRKASQGSIPNSRARSSGSSSK